MKAGPEMLSMEKQDLESLARQAVAESAKMLNTTRLANVEKHQKFAGWQGCGERDTNTLSRSVKLYRLFIRE